MLKLKFANSEVKRGKLFIQWDSTEKGFVTNICFFDFCVDFELIGNGSPIMQDDVANCNLYESYCLLWRKTFNEKELSDFEILNESISIEYANRLIEKMIFEQIANTNDIGSTDSSITVTIDLYRFSGKFYTGFNMDIPKELFLDRERMYEYICHTQTSVNNIQQFVMNVKNTYEEDTSYGFINFVKIPEEPEDLKKLKEERCMLAIKKEQEYFETKRKRDELYDSMMKIDEELHNLAIEKYRSLNNLDLLIKKIEQGR